MTTIHVKVDIEPDDKLGVWKTNIGYVGFERAEFEAAICKEERERIQRQVAPLVAIAISSLHNGGGVTYREAEAMGAKVAALLA